MSIVVRKAVVLPETVDCKVRDCSLPVGFPFLVEEATGKIIEPVLLFLTDHCLSGRERFNPRTAAAYADDLRDWWTYLTHYNLSWDNVTRQDVEHYCQEMSKAVSPKTHKAYSVLTVDHRISTVSSLYRWAQKAGHVNGIGDALSASKIVIIPIDSRALAHIGSSATEVTINIVGPRSPRNTSDHVQVLYPDAAQKLLRQLGPLPTERTKTDTRLSRDRLCAELGIYSGERIHERLANTVYQIQSLPYDPNSQGVCFLKITTTKGSKPRTVRIPQSLLGELLAYIDGEREEALRAAGALNRRDKPTALFLNSANSGRNAGTPLTYDNWNRIFNDAQRRAGLMRKEFFTDPATNKKYERDIPQHQDRDLRHTYAVMRYFSEKYVNNNPEPWLVIKQELGHEHVKTTIDIYLRAASDYERVVGPQYLARLNQLLGR